MTSEPDLARLILDAKGDRSYERMSADCGGLPTDKRLQQMATTPLKAFPDVATIRGLARGTGTTITAVVLAAARSLGLQVHAAEDPDALTIGGAGELRADQVDAVRGLVRVFREMNAESELGAALAASTRRFAAARTILRQVPIDGPNRSKERIIMISNAFEAREALEQALANSPAGAATLKQHTEARQLLEGWNALVDQLLRTAAKFPPVTEDDENLAANLVRAISGATGSGKTEAFLRHSLDLQFLHDGVITAGDDEDDTRVRLAADIDGDAPAKRRRGKASRGGDPKAARDDDERSELAQAAYDSPEPAGIPESGAP